MLSTSVFGSFHHVWKPGKLEHVIHVRFTKSILTRVWGGEAGMETWILQVGPAFVAAKICGDLQ